MTTALGILGLVSGDWFDLLGRVVVLVCAIIGAYVSLSRFLWDLRDRERK